ncbi:MAG TPA: hypothetical protein VFH51_02125 [Myxococcota bacterium]|nr:hypothetical protein [Myxococcota bacterium]
MGPLFAVYLQQRWGSPWDGAARQLLSRARPKPALPLRDYLEPPRPTWMSPQDMAKEREALWLACLVRPF